MVDYDPRDAAAALLDAYRSGVPIAPLSETVPGLSIEQAYGIQLAQVEHWKNAGHVIKGHKVGLTSRAMQLQLGVDQPDYGHLREDMFHLDSAPVDLGAFIAPKVEPEISFVLKRPLAGPGVTVAEAISAVDYAIASLEIIDSRIADWRITLADTIADNASSGGVVLGSRPVALQDLDLPRTGCNLYRNGQVVGTGAGGAVLGSPINALVWLANTLGQLGVKLEAGSVVMPGSVCAAVPVAAGDTVSAEFAGLGLVTTYFESEQTR
ncbi:2-keto-4-pentenoate hydratase [Sinomonas sp. JGH33]|uniref:2-keto-4-pentenoate hydratase n=1 Tax=Sinomonas terricola TaxID=3110330 RepID=A0ABU5TBF2_9MICC|nr:2-keto-4-pentenoate hydratase [Sinomonas sp. JGH33]MEA5457023.1 2-keto-4-pentenoate hydratase [Sinomonas sp. JGH33]